jgi:hypothetical protein
LEELLVSNSFKVDIIADYGNAKDDLILHWGICKKEPLF